jgi:hypothetical protein
MIALFLLGARRTISGLVAILLIEMKRQPTARCPAEIQRPSLSLFPIPIAIPHPPSMSPVHIETIDRSLTSFVQCWSSPPAP